MKGVSKYEDSFRFQFISLDGTRSAFEESDYGKGLIWSDYIAPQGKQIRTVETLLLKSVGALWGFKWIGDDGAVLVDVGFIDSPF